MSEDKEFRKLRLKGILEDIQNYLDDYPDTAVVFMAMENLRPSEEVPGESLLSDISYIIDDAGESSYLSELFRIGKHLSGIEDNLLDLYGGTTPVELN